MSRPIDISDLPATLVAAIEAIIRDYRARPGSPAAGPRPIGWAQGVLPELPESFFDPLPPDVLDAFEGKAA